MHDLNHYEALDNKQKYQFISSIIEDQLIGKRDELLQMISAQDDDIELLRSIEDDLFVLFADLRASFDLTYKNYYTTYTKNQCTSKDKLFQRYANIDLDLKTER